MDNQDSMKMLAAKEAAKLITDGQVVGLGSGSTCKFFIVELGKLVRGGIKVIGVPTSNETEKIAIKNKIKIAPIGEIKRIDIAVDGADEIDPRLNLIKGYGGALLREKIVASLADRFIVIADKSKMVERLGDRGIIPIEIRKDSTDQTINELVKLGKPEIRKVNGKPFVTDNGNLVVDLKTKIQNPVYFEKKLKSIEGVLETGLFLSMADFAIVATEDGLIHSNGEYRHYASNG